MKKYYDVIVIGGGHAACEAALASARLGANTLMLTINPDHIAQMSCNPCIGGVAKGHIVREIDALGGAMALVADASSIQFKMLNSTKGPAVRSPRAQCDKVVYQAAMKNYLEKQENLTIKQDLAVSFLVDGDSVCGVETNLGHFYYSKSTVVATGTFLHGKLHYGLRNYPGGRAGDPPSNELAAALKEQLKLHVGRLKTGTPPRVLQSSIDFSKMTRQDGEECEENFSFFPGEDLYPRAEKKSMPCYMTHTGKVAADLVRNNLFQAPMYNGIIEGIGTRYCPSFEDKVVRFPDHETHHVMLEPEGEHTGEYYVNGLSSSLPPDIQEEILHSVHGLENAVVTRYAYAIEYDFVFPEELTRALRVRKWKGLYHAGQINGTSGYEEAAAQGLLAGLNAARYARNKDDVEFGRDQAYMGVLADDITTKEIVEPYRLFTSRAEYRLYLRQDNADLRLCPLAHSLGLLPEAKYKIYKEYETRLTDCERLARSCKHNGKTLWEHLRDTHGDIQEACLPFPAEMLTLDLTGFQDRKIMKQLAIQAHYEGYMRQEEVAIKRLQTLESWKIPASFNYDDIPGMKNECRMKLKKTAPTTLAQAGRIDGITPAEIGLLQVYLTRLKKQGENEGKKE
ncbi:MAG: tRNA uridine-5-carboxymethylaminomethyl(34) synthesis enzyme MnmG [Lentisphaeria bacterium]|nr:tRNA uridine-5-carboxymethylaminomethyl(34) synthesis enzyme MnmG [Lentisphaeria bacterium]